MKAVQTLLLALAGTALAAPVEAPSSQLDPDFPLAELEAYYASKFEETSPATPLAARQYSASVSNQLTDGTPCRAVTLIYARGTTQQGNIGDPAAVGPLTFNNLARLIGTANLAVQGVTYPANVAGFLAGGDAAGSRTMAQLTARAVTQCPNTKIVLSGYSQGAQVVHNAAGQLTAAQTNRVTAGMLFPFFSHTMMRPSQDFIKLTRLVLTFGDPKRNQPFGTIPASRTRVICRTGDNICEGGFTITPAHTQYQQDAPAAASWIAARVR
ncbi:cutinase [Verticillium dahliae VdLs.17]|uniref:Cutinase n=1 Tax=Verticillium dahliae (strain VdLs.17 / ATCC MYA-4575 / FGSC 10137) TaxID=498257 RepID=G2WUV4_VERDV|nr:cutinase [Verticillium dahliae VdLs.17]EGY20079.1 cutinase [Verticillium dahliae VdLs.17]KAH6690127.1 cutinase [Verticillium dahliae]